MTTTLTDEQREWRKNVKESIDKLYDAIRAINGPYAEMVAAFDAAGSLAALVIDDEDLGPCEACGEPIWMLVDEDDYEAGEDGIRVCGRCIRHWNEGVSHDRQ